MGRRTKRQAATPSRRPAPRRKQGATAPAAEPAGAPTGDPERRTSQVDRPLVGATAGLAQAPAGADEVAADANDPGDAPERDPQATTWTELDLRCPSCNIIHYVPVCIFLNAQESPELVERLARGELNLKRCPLCQKVEPVDYPFTFFDPARKLAVQVRSAWEWHAGGGEEWYAARLEDFFARWAEHDVRIDVVFGQDTFAARFLRDASAPPARR